MIPRVTSSIGAPTGAGRRWIVRCIRSTTLTTPVDASVAQRDRVARRRARIAPESENADFVIHAALRFGASPLPSYFRYARVTGEQSARQRLPQLMASLQRAGLTEASSAP